MNNNSLANTTKSISNNKDISVADLMNPKAQEGLFCCD